MAGRREGPVLEPLGRVFEGEGRRPRGPGSRRDREPAPGDQPASATWPGTGAQTLGMRQGRWGTRLGLGNDT